MNANVFFDSPIVAPFSSVPKRGIMAHKDLALLRISPTNYAKSYLHTDGKTLIPRREIYDAIVVARKEAIDKNKSSIFNPLGKNTHTVRVQQNKNKLEFILDTTRFTSSAFEELQKKYGTNNFSLGFVPYINANLFGAVSSFASTLNAFHSRYGIITSVFERTRDHHPRVYVGLTSNSILLGTQDSALSDF